MQKRFVFDSDTIEKVKKSFLISLTGVLLTAGAFLGQELVEFITNGDPIDYRTALVMSMSAAGAWIANTLREWLKEEEVKVPKDSDK